MTFLSDFVSAVETYPAASVTLSVVDLWCASGSQGAINVKEIWGFKIRVQNTGHLNLKNLALKVEGQNGVTVSEDQINFNSSLTTASGLLAINAHTSKDSALLYFKTPTTPKPAGTALVKAHIVAYDANLDDILINHTKEVQAPVGTFSAQVLQ